VGPIGLLGKRLAKGGIGLGRSIVTVQCLAAAGKLSPQGAALLLNTLWVDPLVGGVGAFVSETASWAAVASAWRWFSRIRRAAAAPR
jgi:hypothetical protein